MIVQSDETTVYQATTEWFSQVEGTRVKQEF